ncbi:MAG TPA: amidohydrolase family protein, partial [Bacteroidia bacterium]|nr:amidohydrolase family protein [Bacteroidia bacterium]
QPTHATSDMYWAEKRLGSVRIHDAYSNNALLKETGMLALGSDFPVEDINPLYGFYAAVVRKDQKGFPPEGFEIENSISRTEALRGMTIWAAYSMFEENEKGSLEKGKAADFVIMNDDLMTAPDSVLFKLPVEATYSNGVKVYENKK